MSAWRFCFAGGQHQRVMLSFSFLDGHQANSSAIVTPRIMLVSTVLFLLLIPLLVGGTIVDYLVPSRSLIRCLLSRTLAAPL